MRMQFNQVKIWQRRSNRRCRIAIMRQRLRHPWDPILRIGWEMDNCRVGAGFMGAVVNGVRGAIDTLKPESMESDR